MTTSVPPAGGVPPAKKKSPLLYILIGCGGVLVLAGIALVLAVSFGLYKVKQAGLDPDLMKKNPAVAMVKMAVAANPNLELVSIDEDRGIVTVRDKRTGKNVTMNFEDIKEGRISFEGEGDDGGAVRATFGAGTPANLPSWFPSYPGSSPQASFAMQGTEGDGAHFQFTTEDSPAQVLQFYEAGFKEAGMTVNTSSGGNGGSITAEDASSGRQAVVLVTSSGGVTNVNGSFKSKN
ncbi:MAG TPA: hypothetical protein PLA43_19420 [Bryobacteraceae bacterium]|nr:hypothetical protein [Bryobacteraceae bacterium]HOL70544.1 hypothetical protein [Bryobacteraceae bacterium]HOQ47256.1 hypothetical protein [Bryobacteraceae bacterium]HPQ14210.1 hypothetical protein [Bryobacteraceae bacterium]HPU74130.1 hypothetical protein [Bryobacteraceae bacterium]